MPSLGVIFRFCQLHGSISGRCAWDALGEMNSLHVIVRPLALCTKPSVEVRTQKKPLLLRSRDCARSWSGRSENSGQRRGAAAAINTEKVKSGAGNVEIQDTDAAGASFTVAGGGYDYEMEALEPIGAEIIEAPANEAEFIAAAKTADAIYAKGMRISKEVTMACRTARSLRWAASGRQRRRQGRHRPRHPRHQRPRHLHRRGGRPCHDAAAVGFPRLVEQDKMVRSGRWSEGRPHS